MAPIPAFLNIYNPCKDLFLYLKGQRKDIKELEERISTLVIQLRSIYSRKQGIDQFISINPVSTEPSNEYTDMIADIAVMHKRYTKFIKKYASINNIHSTYELDMSTMGSMIHQLDDLKSKMVTFEFFKLAKLSRDIVKLSARASNALERLKPEFMTQRKVEQPQEKWDHSNDLPVFKKYVDVVLEYLCSDKNKTVGIFGPFGVGKTTVMRKLHSDMLEHKSLSRDENTSYQLENIILIEYPQEAETESKVVEKLQNEIMVHLNIGHEATRSISKNANTISTFLRQKKYILLMDQVLKTIDLAKLGLREHESMKVVIASSEKIVVDQMTDHVVKVEKLDKADAWTLFENIYGKLYDSRKFKIADRIIECCDGIPWMINGVAKYLKEKNDDSLWNSVKQTLQSGSKSTQLIDLQGIDKVYEIMYEGLTTDSKKCLLYGALFPNQFKIYKNYLIECWIAEGFIVQDVDQEVRANRDYGQLILHYLTDRHLLEWCSDEKYIKMPLNFRRVALELDYPDEIKCRIWVPKDRKPDKETWTTITRMSLIGCNKAELPKSPECCNIYTLLLQLKPNLRGLSDLFFDHMEGLRVLDLNHTEIEALPKSISKLKKLKSLYLNDCHNLNTLPPEADKLQKLEFLDICGTSFSSLPKQIRCMADLRCLRASFPVKRRNHNSKRNEVEDMDTIIPSGIISNLEKLEELSIDTTFEFNVAETLAKELASLEYLTTLCFNFPNVSSANTFLDQSKSFKNKLTNWETQTFRSFKIFIGSHETRRPYESDFSGIHAERWLRYCTNEEFSSACKELLKQASAFEIIGNDGVTTLTCNQFELDSVKVCVLECCNSLKNIVDGEIINKRQDSQSLLQNLEKLYLYDLQLLKCIWDGPVPSDQCLTNLTTISINGCPMLRKIFDPALAHTLRSLQYLKVENCHAISQIVEVHEGPSISEQRDLSDILTSLRKIELLDLPELQSICNSTSISWNSLNCIIVLRCNSLCNLSLTRTNAKKLALIQGEESWWKTIQFQDHELQRSLPFHHFSEESSAPRVSPREEASTSARLEINLKEEITTSNNTSINLLVPSNVSLENGVQSLKEQNYNQ